MIILSVRGWLVRKFMLAAHDLGMTKGDWTFLDVEIVQVCVLFRNKCIKYSVSVRNESELYL